VSSNITPKFLAEAEGRTTELPKVSSKCWTFSHPHWVTYKVKLSFINVKLQKVI